MYAQSMAIGDRHHLTSAMYAPVFDGLFMTSISRHH
jgi:hypothetical protein